jgi:CRP-like cAMP-binding protein
LREELADDAPAMMRLGRPLPARVLQLAPGKLDLDPIEANAGSYGLMVLDGLLLIELEAGRAHIGWLIGPQDLVRPSGMRELALTSTSRWRALTAVRLALLDREFGLRAGGVPLVTRVLVNRAMRTANWLLAKGLIVSSPSVEERILLLFSLLGERWGKVTTEGIRLQLPLTHANLASLCGARRPSVTLALHALERDGLLSCGEKGTWLLPPAAGAILAAL